MITDYFLYLFTLFFYCKLIFKFYIFLKQWKYDTIIFFRLINKLTIILILWSINPCIWCYNRLSRCCNDSSTLIDNTFKSKIVKYITISLFKSKTICKKYWIYIMHTIRWPFKSIIWEFFIMCIIRYFIIKSTIKIIFSSC